MARSQRANPKRLYLHGFDRRRVQVKIDPATKRTRESFADECDINKIIDQHHRTGIVAHLARTEPQYGDAPEATLFEAACVQAELRSADHDGLLAPESPSEAPEGEDAESLDQTANEAPEAPQEAAEGESGG